MIRLLYRVHEQDPGCDLSTGPLQGGLVNMVGGRGSSLVHVREF